MKSKSHKYILRQHMISNDYEIFHYLDTNMKSVSLHHHDFYELYLLISGNITYLIEGKSYNLKPGNIVLINSNELHQAKINSLNQNYERIVLWINKDFLNNISTTTLKLSCCFEAKNNSNVLSLNFEDYQTILSILEKIINLEVYDGIGKEVLHKIYITELIILINDIILNNNTYNLNVVPKKSIIIDKVLEYINNNVTSDITIDELSANFYISKFYLSREFKKYTGTTIHKYIIQKKLVEAKSLILKEIPVIEVYKRCGFGDYSNFFRAFKNEYGVTPKEFLNLMTNIKNVQ